MIQTDDNVSNTTGLDYYWATEDDPKALIEFLCEKRDRYYRFLQGSNIYSRIQRNWEYYHNIYPGTGGWGREAGVGGPDNNLSLIAVNQFRSLIRTLITYTIQQRPAWDVKAINSEPASLEQAEFADLVLDYYMDKMGLENAFKKSVEHALVLTAGYILTLWDYDTGTEIDADPETGRIIYSGDVKYQTPSFFDVIHDNEQNSFDEKPWYLVRMRENLWDLVEKYPDQADEIIKNGQSRFTDDLERFNNISYFQDDKGDSEDYVDSWLFIHKKCLALPRGRIFKFVGDDVPLEDPYENQYDCKVLHRLTPSDILLTCYGYSPGFDLQGLQEMLNMEWSTIATNHNNLGPLKIWTRYGEQVNLTDLEPGVNVVSTETEPKVLSFANNSGEMVRMPPIITKEMESVAQINAVSRGQPEASYRSGEALQTIDAKTAQFNAPFAHSTNKHIGGVGDSTIKILRKFGAGTPRMIALANPHYKNALMSMEFDPWDRLKAIDHVQVEATSPYGDSPSGRKSDAMALLQAGLITTPEEYSTLINTGQLKPLTEAIDSQLMLIHQENDALRNGEPVEVRRMDNHFLHIKKHNSVIDSHQMRARSPMVMGVETHNALHMQQLLAPGVLAEQVALGYMKPQDIQMFMMAIGMGAPPVQGQGSPPGPQQPPRSEPKRERQESTQPRMEVIPGGPEQGGGGE